MVAFRCFWDLRVFDGFSWENKRQKVRRHGPPITKKGAEMALHCWETRGCDEEMASRCPHNIPGERCPGDCKFAVCDRPTHETAWGLDMLENPDVDREVVVKEFCLTCKFFIAHGPKVGSPESIKAREIVDARPYAVKRG